MRRMVCTLGGALLIVGLQSTPIVASAEPAPAPAGSPVEAVAAGRLIVKFRTDAGIAGGRLIAPRTYVVSVPSGQRSTRMAELAAQSNVQWVQPDDVIEAQALPNDTDLAKQDYLAGVNAAGAWDVTHGAPSVVVAVLDTAVDLTHPDLVGKLVSPASFVTAASCPSDDRSEEAHGTVVAGMIGAATDNAAGIAGLGWNTRVMPVQVLCDSGEGFLASEVAAIRYAADHGAGILNMSFSSDSAGPALREAVAYAQSKGLVVVAAAGNQEPTGTTELQYPAALPDVIGVAALSDSKTLASFSDRGPWVDIAAPGDGAYSTVPDGGYLGGWRGTSFAAPLVSATVALIVASRPGITPAGVASRLARGSHPIDAPTNEVAWGGLDAGTALSLPTAGYWLAGANGSVTAFGDAGGFGAPGSRASSGVSAMASTPTGRGYWVVARNGSVFPFGDAAALGSTSGTLLADAVLSAAPTPTGRGLWMVTSRGVVVGYGDAADLGSLDPGATRSPIVGIAVTHSGHGYWLVSKLGEVFPFGDAVAMGSMAGIPLNRPIVGIAADPVGSGYWLVASDGGVFAFGGAPFLGSTGNIRLNRPIVGLVPTPGGGGYRFVASDGGVFAYGNAPFLGSAVGRLTADVVALTG